LWETRRGAPNALRVGRWLDIEVSTALFRRAIRDNMGERFGSYDARIAWQPLGGFTVTSTSRFLPGAGSPTRQSHGISLSGGGTVFALTFVENKGVSSDIYGLLRWKAGLRWDVEVSGGRRLRTKDRTDARLRLVRHFTDFDVEITYKDDPEDKRYETSFSITPLAF
jgi:hypothetical protein